MNWDLIIIAETAIRALITCALLQLAFAMMTRWERRVIAKMQWRLGPNRAGPEGLLQPFADGLKLLFKEQLIPDRARPFLFLVAPCVSLVVSLTSFSVIPVQLGNFPFPVLTPEQGGEHARYLFQIADLNVGVLFLLGITSLSVYGIVLGGWASGNKYSLLGGIRASAQMISYELSLGLALLSPLLMVGSLSFREIALFQSGTAWLFLAQPLACVVFIIAGLAETNRAPFDLPEAEQELGAGFHTEYSGMRFSIFFMAEYIAMMTVSSVLVTVFFGGPIILPFVPHNLFPMAESFLWFALKILICMFCFIWIRATFPRFRYDQLMSIGWRVLLPLGMLNMAITAVGVALRFPWWGYTVAIGGTVALLYIGGKLSRRGEDQH
ncbi:MAG: NADH-quinone oxidoreductase subunit NuoH [Vulcanimicrobiota bacterium]